MRTFVIVVAVGSLACVCGGKPPPVPPPPVPPPSADAGTSVVVNPNRDPRCNSAESVVVDRPLQLTGSRLGEGADFIGSNFGVCSDGSGEEKIYRLEFPHQTEVYMHLETGGWPILQLRRDCASGPDIACGNKQVGLFSTTPAAFTLHVDAGVYYALLDSERTGEEGYVFTVDPQWTAQKAARCEQAPKIVFDAGGWVHSGDTTGKPRMFYGSYAPACDDGRAAEDVFSLELKEATRLTGAISTKTDWGILDVKPSCFTFSSVACANEYSSFFSGKAAGRFDVLIPDAGDFTVVIDSEFDAGVYTASMRATPYTPVSGGTDGCASAILLPGTGRYAGRLPEDGGNHVALSCGSDAGLPEVHFRLDLPLSARVTVNVLGGFTPQTLAHRSGCPGTEVSCTDATLSGVVLPPGTYYFALEIGTQPYTRNYWLDVDVVPVNLDGGVADGGAPDAGACSSPCGTGTFCSGGTCVSCKAAERCGPGCTPCPAATPYCNPAGTACVACRTSDQCPALSPCCTTANSCQTNLIGCQ